MPTCTACGKFLNRNELVAPLDGAGSVRDRCPYDGATVRMTPPLPADGGPLLGFKPLPPPPKPGLREDLGMLAVVGSCAFVAIGLWVVLPLLVLAVIATVVTGNLAFLGAWAVFAVLLAVGLWLMGDAKAA